MKIALKSIERRCRLSVAEAIELTISFGLLTATVIFGILSIVKNDNKK
ncbi:MAG: putative holin-like toxin [Tetragenococcus koreensis]|nr:putative holin-like toxin [Tetragenococcus halophilus]MDN6139611.1 putative holin-like toxin [Tetragenococcus koreensis]MCF1675821.1 putative holin-like toxin [Tetragenococcus halophilus]MDN6166771.1 putative holin-like toxin [Tetragenococcus koreensis]MDN6579935.1 putative holin-like toxin [Tetragenococcus koreensis]MDN6607466.1 putative holin-like toxin [Tetragenococcus halophilus]